MKSHRMRLRVTVLSALTVIVLGSTSELALAAKAAAGTVSYVQGAAKRSPGGTWLDLKEGSKVYQGDRLKTDKGSRLEVTLRDSSRLRMGEGSELKLQTASFNTAKKKKQVSAKLVFGRVWAKVTTLFGNDSEFEVNTDNAVAGVRGTQFSATRTEAGDTTVRVYEGKVLVSNKPIYAVKGHTKENRVEVSGPVEVSKKQWEEMIAGAMQMVQVAANGSISQPQGFELAQGADGDDWETWNSARDKVADSGSTGE